MAAGASPAAEPLAQPAAALERNPLAKDGQQYSAPGQVVRLRMGYTDSNTSVGASRAMSNVYAEYELTADDVVCDTPGGLVVGCAGDGMLYRARFESPDRHIFERGGNPDSLPGEATPNSAKVDLAHFDWAADEAFDRADASLDRFGAMARVFRL